MLQMGRTPVFTSQVVAYTGRSHYYSCEKANRDFGYVPAVPLSEAIQRTIDSFRELRNPKADVVKAAAAAARPVKATSVVSVRLWSVTASLLSSSALQVGLLVLTLVAVLAGGSWLAGEQGLFRWFWARSIVTQVILLWVLVIYPAKKWRRVRNPSVPVVCSSRSSFCSSLTSNACSRVSLTWLVEPSSSREVSMLVDEQLTCIAARSRVRVLCFQRTRASV